MNHYELKYVSAEFFSSSYKNQVELLNEALAWIDTFKPHAVIHSITCDYQVDIGEMAIVYYEDV